MEIPGYAVWKKEKPEKKFEQEPNVPIIDIIRHGETNYLQRMGNVRPRVNVNEPSFALNDTHLDLTREGIEGLKRSAGILAESINKNQEAILIVSSPSDRAHSSALIFEHELRNKGINILNDKQQFKFFSAIESADERYPKLFEKHNMIDDRTLKWGGGPNSRFLRRKRQESEALEFQRFVRHITNIYKYLDPETLGKLKGKRLRVLCFTHAEITNDFIPKTFRNDFMGDAQERGQILEVRPKSQIKEGEEVETNVSLSSGMYRNISENNNRIVLKFKNKEKFPDNMSESERVIMRRFDRIGYTIWLSLNPPFKGEQTAGVEDVVELEKKGYLERILTGKETDQTAIFEFKRLK